TRSTRDWSSDVCSSDLGNPVAAQNRTGARGAGLLGERRGYAEDAAAAVVANAVHAPPVRADHAGDAVVPRQRFVDERVVGIEDEIGRASWRGRGERGGV